MTIQGALSDLNNLLEADDIPVYYKPSIKKIIETIEQELKTEWIPVSKELPEEGKEVLVWYEYFRYGDYNCMWQTYGIGWQYDGHFSVDNGGVKQRVVAWQPLPVPYKAEK